MPSYFPDVNVWLALSDAGHSSAAKAWRWLNALPTDVDLIFSRYTQLGLLRLLTNEAVMGPKTLVLSAAWAAYGPMEQRSASLAPEAAGMEGTFRRVTRAFDNKPATKWIGDCYLLAFALRNGATLVTFDRALARLATEQDCQALVSGLISAAAPASGSGRVRVHREVWDAGVGELLVELRDFVPEGIDFGSGGLQLASGFVYLG
jgi:uncharacterized protein